jgi:hypothetical protein
VCRDGRTAACQLRRRAWTLVSLQESMNLSLTPFSGLFVCLIWNAGCWYCLTLTWRPLAVISYLRNLAVYLPTECTFYRGTEHLHPQGGRSRDGQTSVSLHTMPPHNATTSSFKILYPLHSDRFYIFFSMPCNRYNKISCLDNVMLSNRKTKLYDIKMK